MTWFEIYAYFISPFVMLAAGIGVVYLTGWLDRRDRRRRESIERH